MERLGIAYSITGNYVLKTLPSLVSVLENNRRCRAEDKVEIEVFFYIQDIDEKGGQIERLKQVCESYSVKLHVIDSSECIAALEKAGDEAYNDSLVIDLYVVAPSMLDVDYNVLFLQSDVVMNHGHSLKKLAEYDFEGGKKSCASTIDMQSCPLIKSVMPLPKEQHLFNDGVFLTSPRLYKEHNTFGQYIDSVQERGWKFYPYWNVLRSGYGLRNELSVLPIQYQIYPAWRMLKIPQWKKMFLLENADYYSDEELEQALADPVFIHYINFIVKKPWHRDIPREYKKLGYWPYQDIWNDYADLLGNREALMEPWIMSKTEKIKRICFDYFKFLYVPLCRLFYKKEVLQRNRIIEGLSDKDRRKD